MNKVLESLIQIVKEDSNEALGCTEPVAVAYCANVAGENIDKDSIQKVDVVVSKNIFKNGKAVMIPNTGSFGLDLAAGVGILAPKSDDAYMVFSQVDESILEKAKKLMAEGKINVSYKKDLPDIYVEITATSNDDSITAVITGSHTHISKIIKNGKVILEIEYKKEKSSDDFDIKKLSFEEIRKLIDQTNAKEFFFTLTGIDVNKKASEEGLKGTSSNLGKTLNELKQKGILTDSAVTDARIYTAAAADMRMSGGKCPIVTSGGSGNQGIGVILPIAIVAENEGISRDDLAKSLFYAHLINRYVKEYSGKLSGICGCAIGAAIGATAGITWMLGGTDEQISGACSNIYANLTGVICDGAKESCSMKLSTTAAESVVAAYLSLNGVISKANVGVLGNTIEQTIANIGKLSHEAFSEVDDVMLDIIENRKIKVLCQ